MEKKEIECSKIGEIVVVEEGGRRRRERIKEEGREVKINKKGEIEMVEEGRRGQRRERCANEMVDEGGEIHGEDERE